MRDDMSYTENYLFNRGVRLTPKGKKWAENTEVAIFYIALFIILGIAGSIETGRWF